MKKAICCGLLLFAAPLFAAAATLSDGALVRPMQMTMIGTGLGGDNQMAGVTGTLDNQFQGLSELRDIAVAGDRDAAKEAVGMLSLGLLYHRVLDFKDAQEPDHQMLYQEAGRHLLEVAERNRAGPRPDEVPLEALAGLVAGMGHPEGWLTPAEHMDDILARLGRLEEGDGNPGIKNHARNTRLAIGQLQALSRGGVGEGFGRIYEDFISNYPGQTSFGLERKMPALESGSPLGMGHEVSIRKLSGAEDMQAVVGLQKQVYADADVDMMGTRYLDMLDKIGGHVMGAFYGGRLVGFVLALPGIHLGRPYLYSHRLRVHPDYMNFGLGTQLKLAQRDEALSRGIELIKWLYQPFKGKNAYLNIAKLGAVVRDYRPNYWGSPLDMLSAGLSVDWILAEWWLNSPRVNHALQKQKPIFTVEETIHVPAQLDAWRASAADRPKAVADSNRIREAFLSAFSRGLVVLGYALQDNKDGAYLLGRP